MAWDWDFTWSILPSLLGAAVVTVKASILGTILAMIIGLALAVIIKAAPHFISRSASVFVEFIRGTPLLVQLYFLFYILPDLGIFLSPLTAGVIALGLHYSSYLSEVYRAGINNVPREQWEASIALNLSGVQTWRYVILPQAIPTMILPIANYAIAMFKETPLLATITVVEMMNQARIISNFNYRYIEPFTVIGLFFLIISLMSVFLIRKIDEHLLKPRRR